jgi:aspartyl-tRNA(Asn)/glutamyl-tRNA(Gln) amidotransferase subunit A
MLFLDVEHHRFRGDATLYSLVAPDPMPTADALLDASLAAITQHGAPTNAFILVDETGARAAARAVDEERKRGVDRGPLHGMPISIKDLIDVAGQPTTAASMVRAGHIAPSDAPIVQRLRAAGAVLIGKTNLHEFALGPTNEESAFGPVHNPHDLSRVAGGSSGGSAAAVATGMGIASIGSDTGGSIRIPAAACGVVGLKPTAGEVPLDGVVPLSVTLDNGGPLTRTVTDAAHVWAVLADQPLPRLDAPAASALTFGVLGGYFTEYLEEEVRAAFESALDRIRAAGARVEPRSIAGTETIVDTYSDISLAEAAHWHAPTIDSRKSDYQPGVHARLERGRAIPAVRYLAARDMQRTLSDAVDAALAGCSALVLPTLPIVAPVIGTTEVRFGAANGAAGGALPARGALLRLTQLFNLSGSPAISLPLPVSGLPIGLQLVGRRRHTAELLDVALWCERVLAS